jgi:hypothetical protein
MKKATSKLLRISKQISHYWSKGKLLFLPLLYSFVKLPTNTVAMFLRFVYPNPHGLEQKYRKSWMSWLKYKKKIKMPRKIFYQTF